MLSIVIPTITGREESYARCLESYQRTLRKTRHEIITIKDMHNWPVACNEGYRRAKGDVVHFSADDLEAVEGWHEGALTLLRITDELPGPYVWNHTLEGDPDNVIDGEPGEITAFTRIPIMRRDQYERIGPWPDLDFYCDLWVSEQARALGIETRNVGSYRFIHHWSPVGRITDDPERVARAYGKLEQIRLRDGLVAGHLL